MERVNTEITCMVKVAVLTLERAIPFLSKIGPIPQRIPAVRA